MQLSNNSNALAPIRATAMQRNETRTTDHLQSANVLIVSGTHFRIKLRARIVEGARIPLSMEDNTIDNTARRKITMSPSEK